ncbi:MAG: DUF559 domain-containing protein [Actinobacteria bacterium]|nr:DUF559 domain-containing protein [Actinomycetota bacterium]
MDVVRALAWRGGSAEWADLRAQVSRRAVERAVRDGLVVRPRRGLYVLADLPDNLAAARSVGGVLSHLSAATYLGVPTLRAADAVHVTVPRGVRPQPRPGVRLHWADLTGDADEHATSPVRTVMDCASTLPFADALAVADGVLRDGLLGPDDLVRAAEASRGPGRARRLRVARAARCEAANPFESCLRAVVLDAGLVGFEPQYRVPGTPYAVDLADPVHRVALEADSFRHHGDRAAFRADCRRYDELVRIDWAVLRFAWEDVMFDRTWVARLVSDCCRRRSSADPTAH